MVINSYKTIHCCSFKLPFIYLLCRHTRNISKLTIKTYSMKLNKSSKKEIHHCNLKNKKEKMIFITKNLYHWICKSQGQHKKAAITLIYSYLKISIYTPRCH